VTNFIKSFHKIIKITPRNYFQPKEKIDKMILTGNYDEKELRNLITKMNRVKYRLFLEEIINLKKENHLKEYYLKVSAILRMKHDGSFVTAIKVPGEDLPLFDSKKVNGALAQHCRKNFDDKGWKQTHNPGNIEAITTHQLHQAALKVARNKAISTDLFPDTILNQLNEELTISLTKILNDIFNAKTIPMCISESRLLCLNKDPKTLPQVSGTRPITITSVMIESEKRQSQNY